MRLVIILQTLSLILSEVCFSPVYGENLSFRDEAIKQLVDRVPQIVKTYNAGSGRFGSGFFVVGDQNSMFPLAVAYATDSQANPYYKDPKLLEIVMGSGDALISVQDEQGRWRYDKKDGSYWGQVYMPWTYSRWIRSYALIKDDMPVQPRKRWESALERGFSGISRRELHSVKNIPAHHAMGLYAAGKILGRADWQKQAAEFMKTIVDAQKEGGYWSEHSGPVVRYNHVYVEAIGVYYSLSGDPLVLPALRRAAEFHSHFTYPDGSDVETIDERSVYQRGPGGGTRNVGFTMTAEGRGYLATQWRRAGRRLDPDSAASLVLHGKEGPVVEQALQGDFVFMEGGVPRAIKLTTNPWLVVLSAYTAAPSEQRWIQDRQSFLSIWRDGAGLIAGGGNTKLQPAWSTFVLGDHRHLAHSSGDESPVFRPQGELYYVPSTAQLFLGSSPRLVLTYGQALATLQVRRVNRDGLELDFSMKTAIGLMATGHLPLLPELGAWLETAGGYRERLSEKPVYLDATKLGGWLRFRGVRYAVPTGTTLYWPVLPHNPYRRDGSSVVSEGRIDLRLPLRGDGTPSTILLE